MDPISNADRLVLLLRQKLEERAKAGIAVRSDGKAKAGTRSAGEASGVRALAAVEGVDERSLRRAVVQNLLADEIDPELINDAQFQQIVTRVTEAIEEDANASGLLARVVSDLRLS